MSSSANQYKDKKQTIYLVHRPLGELKLANEYIKAKQTNIKP